MKRNRRQHEIIPGLWKQVMAFRETAPTVEIAKGLLGRSAPRDGERAKSIRCAGAEVLYSRIYLTILLEIHTVGFEEEESLSTFVFF